MVKRNLCFALLLVAFLTCDGTSSTENSQINRRIVNGTSITVGQAPFYVRILIDQRYLCGGSLITVKRVVTAGHCVDGKFFYFMHFGHIADKSDTGLQSRFAFQSNAIVHPEYSRKSLANDIAIIQLSTPVEISSYVNFVAIDRSYVNENESLIVIGDGLDGDRNWPRALQWANQVSISNSDCAKAFNKTNILATTFCTRAMFGIESTCNGDSGGPLISLHNGKPQLVGVTSFGGGNSRGCNKGLPSGFTRISDYLEFIDKNIS